MQQPRHGNGKRYFRLARAERAVVRIHLNPRLKTWKSQSVTSKLLPMNKSLIRIPVERIEKSIYLIRAEKVMLDRALASLYGVSTKAFNQAVKRHKERFPSDFMFQLTMEEAQALRSRSQTVTLKRGQNIKYRPYASQNMGFLCCLVS
jgi:hypothetical protein